MLKTFQFKTWCKGNKRSLKSDDSRLRYSGKTILKMAAVLHLEFSKIAILVTWPASDRDYTSSHRISH